MKDHYGRRALAAALCALIATALCGTAAADTNSNDNATVDTSNGQVTVTDQQSTFSNPDYGPWSVQTLQYQWQADKNDIPSITLFNRTDDDHPIGSSSRAVYGDDYHTWSNSFYTYAQLSFADGDIQPYNLAYLEGDLKLDREQNLVAAAGGGATRNPDGTSTRWISAGPSFYTGPMVFEVRFMPANTNGIGTSATEGVIQYNRLGHDQATAIVLNGSQPSVLVGLPASFATFQRLTEYDLTWRHWLSPKFGFVIGGTLGTHADRNTGTLLYNQHAITFGVFFGRAVAQPR